MPIQNTSIVWKINIFLQLLSLLLNIIGYCTNYIGRFGDFTHLGLWEMCEQKSDICVSLKLAKQFADISMVWAYASRVFLGICLTGQSLVILLTLSALVIKTNKFVAWCTIGLAFFSVLFGAIGIAVAAGEIKRLYVPKQFSGFFSVGWSFDLVISSLVMFLVAGILSFVETRRPAT
ncbi:uncharacterized protein LOC131929593 [Physella acuta]|uniref:uncharacterized protein LOC131929593 n=1 Tax=Physella acuta TaxID=109671 RepID=UPI0027DC09E9|nr:uncharacterized protein LOC131929593 [Physella acuta]